MDEIKFKKYDKRPEESPMIDICLCSHKYIEHDFTYNPELKKSISFCKKCMCSKFEKVCEVTWEEYQNYRNDDE